MRDLSLTEIQTIMKVHAGSYAAFYCIELAHPDLETPLRFVCSEENKVHGGQTYAARGFKITLPSQSRDALGDGSITIDDTDLALTYWVESINRRKRTTLTLFVISTTNLDTKIVSAHSYRITKMNPVGQDMHIQLTYEDSLREPATFCKFDAHYPALHQVVNS